MSALPPLDFHRQQKPGRLQKVCQTCGRDMWVTPSNFDRIKSCSAQCRPSEIRGSKMRRALVALSGHEALTQQEFARILGGVCDTKEQIHNLSSEMAARGFVKLLRVITPEARQAIERMTGG